jgi:hypothetical protein
MADEINPALVDGAAMRKLYADELRKLTCNGLARKVESGYDTNPRTLAAINLGLRLLGKEPPADRFIREP